MERPDYKLIAECLRAMAKDTEWPTSARTILNEAALLEAQEGDALVLEWRDGAPRKPWAEEWFIAETTYGDRVVLRSLSEEYAYDFKTADETYIKADRIKRWMQFPDSIYIEPAAKTPKQEGGERAQPMGRQGGTLERSCLLAGCAMR